MNRSPLLLQERDEGVLTLTLNLPEQRNPVSGEAMVDALREGLEAADPPHATRMSKRLLREAQTASLPTILEMSAAMQGLAHATADNQEAIDAFVERRPPVFRGE